MHKKKIDYYDIYINWITVHPIYFQKKCYAVHGRFWIGSKTYRERQYKFYNFLNSINLMFLVLFLRAFVRKNRYGASCIGPLKCDR